MQKNQPLQTRLFISLGKVISQLVPNCITNYSLKSLLGFLIFTGIMNISCKEPIKQIETGKRENVIPDSATAYVQQLTNQQVRKLENSIVMKGDVEAYKKLRIYYLRRFELERLLYYSIIMGHKYNNEIAYGDAGDILLNYRTQYEVDSLDIKTKTLTMYFLLSAYERGNSIGEQSLLKVFKHGKYPESNRVLNSNILR